MTKILAIETSCDETGVAVMQREKDTITVLASRLASQVDVHALTGGVVPNTAAREHEKVLLPLITDALQESGLKGEELDALAVTVGPGLMPALAVGVRTARALAKEWNKPLVPVHHIEGHIYSALLEKAEQLEAESYKLPSTGIFPALALIVSGGHTQLILVTDWLQYEIIGSTRDDAAGEAFDKVARLLDLPYPGGPALSKLAEQGNPTSFKFPRPMINSGDLDFSFSGLKTAVLYKLKELVPSLTREGQGVGLRADIAASFQAAVVDTLVAKTKAAINHHTPATLILAGGVAANEALRQALAAAADAEGLTLRTAPKALCGDNAIMIGQAGLLAYERGRLATPEETEPVARPSLKSFSQPVA
jgi:N6-L-threonylcarbamoyladenine synthase